MEPRPPPMSWEGFFFVVMLFFGFLLDKFFWGGGFIIIVVIFFFPGLSCSVWASSSKLALKPKSLRSSGRKKPDTGNNPNHFRSQPSRCRRPQWAPQKRVIMPNPRPPPSQTPEASPGLRQCNLPPPTPVTFPPPTPEVTPPHPCHALPQHPGMTRPESSSLGGSGRRSRSWQRLAWQQISRGKAQGTRAEAEPEKAMHRNGHENHTQRRRVRDKTSSTLQCPKVHGFRGYVLPRCLPRSASGPVRTAALFFVYV